MGSIDMKILMVGGTGVLSSAVAKEALCKGLEVTMINRGNRRKNMPQGVELIVSDKDNHERISHLLKGRQFDAVMDFLCYNEQELERSFSFYSQITKQYFFISSAAVYNNSIIGPCRENHPKIQPLWSYSVNKWKSEEKLMALAMGTDVNYTIVRPMVTYDDTRIPYGIAPLYGFHWTIIERILHDKPIITWNQGANRCNMMRVEDFAVAFVGLIGNEKAYNEAFNICGDEAPSFKEVLDIIGDIVCHEVKTIDVAPEFYAKENPGIAGELLGGRAITTLIDNTKIKDVVPNFSQRIFLKEGIFRTIDAYKKKNYQKGIDWSFEAMTDKVIYSWCKQQGLSLPSSTTSFINYLGKATLMDRYCYWIKKHSSNFIVKTYLHLELKTRQIAYRLLR